MEIAIHVTYRVHGLDCARLDGAVPVVESRSQTRPGVWKGD